MSKVPYYTLIRQDGVRRVYQIDYREEPELSMGDSTILKELIGALEKTVKASEDNLRQDPAGVTRSKETKAIVIPEGMSYSDAKKWITHQEQAEEAKIQVVYDYDCYPWDGSVAFMKVMEEIFGFYMGKPIRSFFGEICPAMIEIEVGYGKTAKVFWGQLTLPGIDGTFNMGSNMTRDGRLVFRFAGTTKKKYESVIDQLAARVREYLKENSIYRGNAIVLTDQFPDEAPKFMNLTGVSENDLILNHDTELSVRANLFTIIEKYQELKRRGIPFKRGVLLTGKYGTGKTLTAQIAAQKCVANRVTFIYLQESDQLPKALAFARTYGPAIVFAEDIDRVVGLDRTDEANEILNAVDGIESKSDQVSVILTTNSVGHIHEAMLRPGRLDAVISFNPPDNESAQRLVRHYGRDHVLPNEDLEETGRLLDGQIPAVIREVVERAKLISLSNDHGETLTSGDLELSARLMLEQLDLLKTASEGNGKEKSPWVTLGESLDRIVVEEDLSERVNEIYDTVEQLKKGINYLVNDK